MQLFVCKMIVVWLLVRMSLLLRNRLFPVVVVVVLGGGTFFLSKEVWHHLTIKTVLMILKVGTVVIKRIVMTMLS